MAKDSSGLNSNLSPTFEPPDTGFGAVGSFGIGSGSGGDNVRSALEDADKAFTSINPAGNDTGINLMTTMDISGDDSDPKLRSASDGKFPT